MANPRLIKKRVGSIKNIGKITKALEMVSASKIQKAQSKALSAKPYAGAIYEMIANLSYDFESNEIPLMRQPKFTANDLYVLISTNRGLAGSLNVNLFKKIESHIDERGKINHNFITVGKKGRYFALTNGKLVADLSEAKERVGVISAITKIITEGFAEQTYDEVYIAYSDFITAFSQVPSVKKILPVSRNLLEEVSHKKSLEIVGHEYQNNPDLTQSTVKFYYEPDPISVLNNLLPFYIEIQIAEAIFEAEASEHSARMIAMKNAYDNATELSDGLSLEYNKARQSMITTEINDITVAQSVLR